MLWNLDDLFTQDDFRVLQDDGEIRAIAFANEPFHGQPTEVFAYLGVPAGDGPVPGVLCVHGGGGRAFREWVQQWVDRGFAAIAMDFGGCGPDGERLPNAGPAQDHPAKFDPSVAPEDIWTYHAIAAIIRSHNILAAEPQVDAARIGVTGISWGGYLTCIISGVDPRLKCAVPVYGCGFLQHNSAVEWMNIFADMTPAQRTYWHERYDPSIYLPSASMPMLFVSGTNDFAYPMDSLQRSYRLPAGKVETCIRVNMPHSHEDGWAPAEIAAFLSCHLNDGEALPHVGEPSIDSGMLVAAFNSSAPIQEAKLAYTLDDGNWMERRWQETSASANAGTVFGVLPDGVQCCFLNVSDANGMYASSPHLCLSSSAASTI